MNLCHFRGIVNKIKIKYQLLLSQLVLNYNATNRRYVWPGYSSNNI